MRHRLSGSTLVETLIMMIVAAVVFLVIMDGMILFSRVQAQRSAALLSSGSQADGYYRVVSLISVSDSVVEHRQGVLEVYRSGRPFVLSLSDSMLIYNTSGFCDTLLRGVADLRLREFDAAPDTVELRFETAFTAMLPVVPKGWQYRTALEEIEREYVYE